MRLRQLALTAAFPLLLHSVTCAAPPLDGITFATEPGKIYLPLDDAKRQVRLRTTKLAEASLRQLPDGTRLVSLADLTKAGASVERDESGKQARVSKGLRSFAIAVGIKRAEVSLGEQRLRAWQGKRLVLDTNVSSGRRGSTPSGNFTAGPYKARRHYSSRFDNAPMPWSVQIYGHVFIHGFTSVPDFPASHGCIRVPLDKGNPAKFFYEWIDRGTPVRVTKK